MRSCWIVYQGKRIFYGDFRNFKPEDLELMRAELVGLEAVLCREPDKSVLLLCDFRGSVATSEAMVSWKAVIVHINKPVVKLAALGITGFKKVLFDVLARLSGINAMPFGDQDQEQAQAWLIQ